ncbi:tyrosine-type recombinase/integrase [Geomonas agri]|uniref:tyrosine-type recombinase/integrase n=1 Tax=Geomonas agri TaxID=2873702 RepID=UPI001CD28D91|nr:site-specific integrase [Geomonas agri]
MSVYKRGAKGVFYMNFTVNGVRVFKSTGKFTKKEAKHAEAMERQKLMEQASLTPQEIAARTPLSEAIEQVYQTRWKNNKDGKQSRTRALRLIELIGDVQVGSINEDVVRTIIYKLEVTKVKSATVNRYLEVLKTILRYKRQEWDFIHLKKQPKGRIRVLSKQEEDKAIKLLRETDHCSRRHFYPQVADLVEILLDTGCRLSEVLNLQYDDVNFDTNLISIWINKGDRPRSIPMTSRVRGILLERQKSNKKKPFTVTIYQAGKAWAWVRKEMALERDNEFVLHALRHTCATRLVNKGVDLYVVKEWLGHSSIQVTERYAHLSPHKLAHAAKMLE